MCATIRSVTWALLSNFGHLDTAAGAAGLIKASLALHKKTVPPTAGIQKLCDALVSGTPPFIVNQDSVELPALSGQSRCAGVSSFGIGGTNAHIVLEEAPSREKTDPVRTNIIVPISAPDRDRLADLRTECQRVIADRPADLAEMAYSWQVGRKQFANRGFFSRRSQRVMTPC